MAPAIELKILDERIRTWGIPRYQSEMAAGVDLFACVGEAIAIAPGAPAVLIPAGIALHIGDPGLAAIVVPRSGLGHAMGLVLGNTVGVIDADYTGPLMISAWNRSPSGSAPISIAPGDRIAQLLFVPIARPEFAVVEEFSTGTLRGAGGFGSTGHAS